ncbi:MAG TPA: class I SAM-dependent methyltransferase [Candidatus Baltobacteraceae bacterium]|nr:class I SAM-dependent methyltransferase [Candidatus Baltobacteraceae bacterium]
MSGSLQQFYDAHKTDVPHVDARLSLVAKLVGQVGAGSALDVACGRGTLLRTLQTRYPQLALTGADISQDSVEATRRFGLRAEVANVEKALPFADESFDCVVFGEVIEHLVDPDAALQNISRVLKAGGHLILTTPNLASWFNRAFLLFGIQPIFTETSVHVNLGRIVPALGQWKPTQGHLKVFTKGALLQMLEANGFRVERLLGAPYPQPSPAALFDRLMSRFPSLASNFVVCARNDRTLATNYPRLPGWLDELGASQQDPMA